MRQGGRAIVEVALLSGAEIEATLRAIDVMYDFAASHELLLIFTRSYEQLVRFWRSAARASIADGEGSIPALAVFWGTRSSAYS